MKKYYKGEYIELTTEEIAELQAEVPTQEPTTEERLEALEAAMLEQILRSVSGD